MQRHALKADSALAQHLDQRRREMQAGGWRRDGALFARKHGLVVAAVVVISGPASGDIGRQRHIAAFSKRLIKHRPVKRKAQRDLATLPFGFHRRVELIQEADPAFGSEAYYVP